MAEPLPVATPAKPLAVQVSPSLRAAPVEAPPVPVVEAPAPVDARPTETQLLESRAKELEKSHARISRERRELAAERAAMKAQADEVAEYKRIQADKRRNPDKYLKADYGDDYYDKLTRLKTDGVVPADLIASEMDERVASLQKKHEELAQSLEKKLADAQTQENERAKAQYLNQATEYAKANAEKYKAIAHFKEFGSVAAEIQNHFRATCKQDDEGNWLPGETLTPEKAADTVEKRIAGLAEQFRSYFAAETPKATTTPEAPKRQEPTRRREEEVPDRPLTDRERLLRAYAVGDREMASRQH